MTYVVRSGYNCGTRQDKKDSVVLSPPTSETLLSQLSSMTSQVSHVTRTECDTVFVATLSVNVCVISTSERLL